MQVTSPKHYRIYALAESFELDLGILSQAIVKIVWKHSYGIVYWFNQATDRFSEKTAHAINKEINRGDLMLLAEWDYE